MRHLFLVLVLGLLIILPSCKYFKGGLLFGKKAKTLIMKAKADSVRVADSLQKVKDLLYKAEQFRVDSMRMAEDALLALQSKHKYNIIVGSFVTPEYAKLLIEDYRKQGYDPKILRMEGSQFELVSIEAYDSFAKAISQLEKFKDTVQLDSWLYVKR